MNEPAQTLAQPLDASIGASIGGALASPLLFLGPHPEVFGFALFAAFFSSIWVTKIDKRWKAGAAVLFSTMLAGFLAKVATTVGCAVYPPLIEAADALRVAAAILLAGVLPAVFPVLIDAAKDRTKKEVEGSK